MTLCKECRYLLDGNPSDPYFCLINYPCKDYSEAELGKSIRFWTYTIKDILCGKIDCEDFVKDDRARIKKKYF